MRPGEAPVRMDGQTFNDAMVGLKVFEPNDPYSFDQVWDWVVAFSATHIEPIEDET